MVMAVGLQEEPPTVIPRVPSRGSAAASAHWAKSRVATSPSTQEVVSLRSVHWACIAIVPLVPQSVVGRSKVPGPMAMAAPWTEAEATLEVVTLPVEVAAAPVAEVIAALATSTAWATWVEEAATTASSPPPPPPPQATERVRKGSVARRGVAMWRIRFMACS